MKEREKWRQGSREYDVKLIYHDALAAIFMNHRESDSFEFFLSMQIIQGKTGFGFETLLIYLRFTISQAAMMQVGLFHTLACMLCVYVKD